MRLRNSKLHRGAGGFSLIELLVVLVILGLLMGIVAPQFIGEADVARTRTVFADFDRIKSALQIYKLDNYVYPTSEQGLKALVEKPTMDPVPRKWKSGGYVERVPTDPWGNEYLYLSPGEHGQVDIFTYGADGVPGGEGPNTDLGNWQTLDEVLASQE
ncbi:type II secretion system major pseudopilin GspG [Gilvimarinus sp. F26214L]|uniref:type II secretion system major pseudopilin GspG n=1 Tax=Gilvimarinus sp. DZF01 TaxID=3461371 RepID=UPI00404586A3